MPGSGSHGDGADLRSLDRDPDICGIPAIESCRARQYPLLRRLNVLRQRELEAQRVGLRRDLFAEGTVPAGLKLVDSKASTTGVVIGTYEIPAISSPDRLASDLSAAKTDEVRIHDRSEWKKIG